MGRAGAVIGGWALAVALGAVALAADGQAVFEKREALMKQLGKPFYLTIGRAAKGSQPLGPDTVTAAETVATLVKDLQPDLFAAGSNVGGSKIKPEIFAAPEQVAQLSEAARRAAVALLPAVQSGDQAALNKAFATAAQACAACHKSYRIED